MDVEVVAEIYPRYNSKFETKLVLEIDGESFRYLLVFNDDFVLVLDKSDYFEMLRMFNGDKNEG